jgi:hypothetical protein
MVGRRLEQAGQPNDSDQGPHPDGEAGLSLVQLSTNLHELGSALAAMGHSRHRRVGRHAYADALACAQPDLPQSGQASALETAIGQIPEGSRRDLQAVLNHEHLSPSDVDTLLNADNRRNASLLIMRELANIAQQDGAAGLNGDHARSLIGVLRRMGNDAAPALFATADDENAPAPLRRLARDRIASLNDGLGEGQSLRDLEGHIRRALGPHGIQFSAEYQNGELTSLNVPHVELTRVRPGVYSLTTNRFGEVRTQEFSDATVRVTSEPPAPALQRQGDYVTVNLSVGGRQQFGTSVLIRAAQNR